MSVARLMLITGIITFIVSILFWYVACSQIYSAEFEFGQGSSSLIHPPPPGS